MKLSGNRSDTNETGLFRRWRRSGDTCCGATLALLSFLADISMREKRLHGHGRMGAKDARTVMSTPSLMDGREGKLGANQRGAWICASPN